MAFQLALCPASWANSLFFLLISGPALSYPSVCQRMQIRGGGGRRGGRGSLAFSAICILHLNPSPLGTCMLRITKYPSRIFHVKIIDVKGLGHEINHFWKVYNIKKLVLSVYSLMVVKFFYAFLLKNQNQRFACFYENAFRNPLLSNNPVAAILTLKMHAGSRP